MTELKVGIQRLFRHTHPKSSELKVNWFIRGRNRNYNRMPASVWIRCLQLITYLEERGISCTVNNPRAPADICVFVRWQDEKAYSLAKKLHAKGQHVIFDLCVNYFDETGERFEDYGVSKERVKECTNMLSIADAVTCASKYIADRASSYHPKAVYLPDSIDTQHFKFRKPDEDFKKNHLRAIWSGVSVKAHELEPILPLLAARDIEIFVISDTKPPLKFPFTYIPWRYETFPNEILNGELCISHRQTDNPYNLGHSLFKIGVFMSQGVPALASPIPSYNEILKGGRGGLICHTIKDWEEALDRVIKDRELLLTWSKQAVAALKPYTTHHVTDDYVALFHDLCGR